MNREEFHRIKDRMGWSAYAQLLLNEPVPRPKLRDEFGTFWIEAGHHVREQIADDRVLVQLLRHLLPPYHGQALELFRGENRSRWESGNVGLAWTTSEEAARMFAGGLNAVRSGGVLLQVRAEPSAIITGPNAHSSYLGESQFTVDPFALSPPSVVATFPAVAL